MTKDRIRKYERPIGLFCGGFLGLLASSLVAALPSINLATSLVMITSGTAAGLILGGKFPSLSQGVYLLFGLLQP